MATPHRVLVLGATGPTGRQIVPQALAQGHYVTAVSRHADVLNISHSRLVTHAADVSANPSPLPSLVAGHDVVISALGVGRSFTPRGLIARAAPAIVAAMRAQAVRRLVFVSAFGVGGTAPLAPLVFRLMFRTVLRRVYDDKAAGEATIRDSGLDWTILAPVLLTDTAGTRRYRLEHEPVRGPWRISRADVASAALACIDDGSAIGRRLVVAP